MAVLPTHTPPTPPGTNSYHPLPHTEGGVGVSRGGGVLGSWHIHCRALGGTLWGYMAICGGKEPPGIVFLHHEPLKPLGAVGVFQGFEDGTWGGAARPQGGCRGLYSCI